MISTPDCVDCGEGEEGGGEGGEGGQEVHTLGYFAEGDEGLGQFAEQGEEGVAGWMGETQFMRHHGVFGGVAEDGDGGQGEEVQDED